MVHCLVKRKGEGRVSSSVQTASTASCRARLVHYTRLSSHRNVSIIHQGGVVTGGLQLVHHCSVSALSDFLDSRHQRTVAMQPANAAGNESFLPRSIQCFI